MDELQYRVRTAPANVDRPREPHSPSARRPRHWAGGNPRTTLTRDSAAGSAPEHHGPEVAGSNPAPATTSPPPRSRPPPTPPGTAGTTTKQRGVAMTVRSTRSGHDGPKCGGRKKQGGGKCTQTAGWGTNHQGVGRCKLHGGSTHTHIAAAGSAKVEEDAREVLAQLDVAPVEDPLTELAKVAGEVVAWKNAVATQVNKISAMRFLDDKGAEQLRAEVAVWERALDRAVTTLATIAKLNIEERLLALDQRRADMVGDALDRLFDHLGLTPAARKEAGAIVARHLRSVTGGQDRSA